MLNEPMTVADRINALKSIFADFGIPVLNNSVLEQCITAEFGRGKRSELNQILLELRQDTDAGALSACIGTALEKNTDDPQITTISYIMRERLPSVLQIIDVRQQTSKRIQLLEQLLLHFEDKLKLQLGENSVSEQVNRLLRMLAGARDQLKNIAELQAIGGIVEKSGIIFNKQDLRRGGRILQELMPALIAIDQPNIIFEQKINLCVQAVTLLSRELNNTKLNQAARIIDDVHWLYKIILPEVPDQATIEQALQNMGISLGNITIGRLQNKAKALGLTEHELIQIIYANQSSSQLSNQEQKLLSTTQENKKYAAVCGVLAKLGQDIDCKDLERIGLVGLCVSSMRQTYYEFKTNNLNSVNFSESLGLIVSSIGVITGNQVITKIGASIIEGVKAYAGIMAIPGGQAVALPLAICAVVSKVLLGNKSSYASQSYPPTEAILHKLLQQIVSLQLDMRRQFTYLYELLENQHKHLLIILDQNFCCLATYSKYYNIQTINNFASLSTKLDGMLVNITKEFSDLYLEYIRDPIEEIDFFDRYGQGDMQKLQSNKLKLSMWLLFKAKHQKVNGRDLIAHVENTSELSSYINLVLDKIVDKDAVLGMVNRYVNLEFKQQLPEELPHLPTWLLAADRYILLLNNYNNALQTTDREPQIITDIIAVGEQILHFVHQLSTNDELWKKLREGLQQQSTIVQTEIDRVLYGNNVDCQLSMQTTKWEAKSAPTSEQLENFDSVNIDITETWIKYFAHHIPQEIFMAEAYGLGKLHINFTIDPGVNRFMNVHIPYGHNLLPDDARDVLYRIDLYFKLENKLQPDLLLSGWFAYDLCNSFKRFHEYYNLKFKYGLRHTRYHWISINGMRNQVEGHGDTDTHKLIDYDRLSGIYKNWWLQVQPVNEATVLSRVKQNHLFYSKCAEMLDAGQFIILQLSNIELLKIQLQNEIQDKNFKQNLNIVSMLQDSKNIWQALGKIDAYNSVLSVFMQIIHAPWVNEALSSQFNSILNNMTELEKVDVDFKAQLRNLCPSVWQIDNSTDYKSGEFYQRIELTLTRLQLLINTMAPTVRLGC